jgi:hypothetical protein
LSAFFVGATFEMSQGNEAQNTADDGKGNSVQNGNGNGAAEENGTHEHDANTAITVADNVAHGRRTRLATGAKVKETITESLARLNRELQPPSQAPRVRKDDRGPSEEVAAHSHPTSDGKEESVEPADPFEAHSRSERKRHEAAAARAAQKTLTQNSTAASAKAGDHGVTGAAAIDGDGEPAAVAAPSRPHKAHRREPRSIADDPTSNQNKLKLLTLGERRLCIALRDALLLVAAEAIARSNRVPQLCHDLETTLRSGLQHAEAAVVKAASDVAPTSTGDLNPAADGDEVIDATDATATAAQAGKAQQPRFIPLPPADLPAVVNGVLAAVEAAKTRFAADVEECQLDLDDNLIIRPIAQAIAKALNSVEGFVAPMDLEYSDKMREARRKHLDSIKAKRDKAVDKLRAKQDDVLQKQEAKRKAEEARQVEQKAAKGQGTEDSLLDHALAVQGVMYAPLPLYKPQYFETALRIWSMVTSVPKLIKLTQMPFSLFLLGLQDYSATGKATLMRDVLRGLIEAAGGADIMPRSGAPWLSNVFAQLLVSLDEQVEAAVAAAGGKKLTAAQKRSLAAAKRAREQSAAQERKARQRHGSDSDSPAYDDDDTSDDDDDEDGDEDEVEDGSEGDAEEEEDAESSSSSEDDDADAAAKEAARAKAREGRLQKIRREIIESQATMRELHATYSPAKSCNWVNLDPPERLQLLDYFMLRALEAPKFVSEAEAVDDRCRTDVVRTEKKMKEIRDQADKAVKELVAKSRAAKKAAGPKGKKGAKSDSASPAPDDDGKESDDGSGDESDADAKLLAGKKPTTKKAVKGGNASPEPEPVAVEMSSEELAGKKKEILDKAEKAANALWYKLLDRWEKEDFGLRIRPLGEDRHHRFVWYFPQDRRLLVQTVPGYSTPPNAAGTDESERKTTWGTPAIPPPGSAAAGAAPKTLIDEEDDSMMARRRGTRAAAESAAAVNPDAATATSSITLDQLKLSAEQAAEYSKQTTWGYVAAADLSAFVQSLDPRGRREGPLRKAVQVLESHLKKQEVLIDSMRLSRRGQQDFGYTNRQRPTESGWNW